MPCAVVDTATTWRVSDQTERIASPLATLLEMLGFALLLTWFLAREEIQVHRQGPPNPRQSSGD